MPLRLRWQRARHPTAAPLPLDHSVRRLRRAGGHTAGCGREVFVTKSKLYTKLVLQHLNRNALSGAHPHEQMKQASAWAAGIVFQWVQLEVAHHRNYMRSQFECIASNLSSGNEPGACITISAYAPGKIRIVDDCGCWCCVDQETGEMTYNSGRCRERMEVTA